jgi:hypothetical protein
MPRALVAAGLCAAVISAAPLARAAPPWVDRHLTMPSGTWAFDLGAGVGRVPYDSGFGVNLEGAVAIDRVELGVRTGLRTGDAGERGGIQPDTYGRLFDRQYGSSAVTRSAYFDGGSSVMANPELRVRVALVRGPVVDLAIEGRVIIPLENPSAGIEPGLPLAFHLGDRVRLDTGVFLPIIVGGPDTYSGISVPLDLWIQITPRLWLGPMTGLRSWRLAPPSQPAEVAFGFGLGYQILHNLDFKTMLLFPAISDDARVFGVGAGIQIRIE